MMTLRPRGPSVVRTARASLRTPLRISSRASWSYAIFLALIAWCSPVRRLGRSLDDREDVVLADEEVLLAVDLDLAAGVAAEDDPLPGRDRRRGALAVVEELAVADRDDDPLLRLLLGGVGQDDSARRLLLGLDSAHEDVLAERLDLAGRSLGRGLGHHGSPLQSFRHGIPSVPRGARSRDSIAWNRERMLAPVVERVDRSEWRERWVSF